MTQEQIQKIIWLNRAFHAEKAARAWLEKCERDKSAAQRLSRYSDGTGNSTGSLNTTEDALIRLAADEQKTQEKLRELVCIREEVAEAIRKIDDSDLQAVLVWRYLNYLTFEQTAVRMNYDERTIRRKHKKALDKIVL